MIMAPRPPGPNSASSSARATGSAISLKSEYVSRVFSLSRSDSIRQSSFGHFCSASRRADPKQPYRSKSSMCDGGYRVQTLFATSAFEAFLSLYVFRLLILDGSHADRDGI